LSFVEYITLGVDGVEGHNYLYYKNISFPGHCVIDDVGEDVHDKMAPREKSWAQKLESKF